MKFIPIAALARREVRDGFIQCGLVLWALVDFQALGFLNHQGAGNQAFGDALAQFGRILHLALAFAAEHLHLRIHFGAVDFSAVHGGHGLRQSGATEGGDK